MPEVKSEYIGKIVELVNKFNTSHGISNPPVMWNITYLALALSGEAGEVGNAVKKVIRDDYSEERMENLREEIIDVAIYLSMLVEALGMDFDHEFDAKQELLEERYEKFQNKGFNILENLMRGLDTFGDDN